MEYFCFVGGGHFFVCLKFYEDLKLVKLRFGENTQVFVCPWFFSLAAVNSVPFGNRHWEK